MRLLVTGAGGFVGGHLVDYVRAGHPAVRLFGLERSHGAAPHERPSGMVAVNADLDDRASVEAALEEAQPDAVVHLAGQSSVQSSWTDPGSTLRTNVMGAIHLLDGLRRRGRPTRVLVVGSADEYGPVAPEELPLGEDRPLRPASPYAVSKAAQGLLALQYAGASGLSVVVTRTFPHTGPRRGEAFAESSFARQIAEAEAGHRPPTLKVGNLEAVRDFTDVRDVVRAYWGLLEHGASGQVYNVCRGTGVRIADVLAQLLARTPLKVDVQVDPHRLRPLDVPALVGDPARIRAATGWEARIPLATTLADLLDDWRQRLAVAAQAEP